LRSVGLQSYLLEEQVGGAAVFNLRDHRLKRTKPASDKGFGRSGAS
jgi:hypothetical protein